MSDRLFELAKQYKVETTTSIPYRPSGQFGPDPDAGEYSPLVVPRNRLDVAIGLLGKLPVIQGIRCLSFDFVGPPHRKWTASGEVFADFPAAVIALAERAKERK